MTTNEIAKIVHNLLKEHGFKRRGRVLTRSTVESGLLHVVGSQSGLGASVGLFRVNFGVFIDECFEARTGRCAPHRVSDFDCFIRVDLAALMNERDWGWPLEAPKEAVTERLLVGIKQVGLPFLDRCSTRKQILERDWSKFPDRGFGLDPISRSAILVRCGLVDEATSVLEAYASTLLGYDHGAQEYVKQAAGRLGLKLNLGT